MVRLESRKATTKNESKLRNYKESKQPRLDRKSTRLNSSHSQISYAVFCLKKKKALHSGSAYVLTQLRVKPRAGSSACINTPHAALRAGALVRVATPPRRRSSLVLAPDHRAVAC